jgi:hypothetical protein
MRWQHKEKVNGKRKGGDELRIGIASWDDGSDDQISIKYTWFDKTGRAARGGEVPMTALPQKYDFAKRLGYIR